MWLGTLVFGREGLRNTIQAVYFLNSGRVKMVSSKSPLTTISGNSNNTRYGNKVLDATSKPHFVRFHTEQSTQMVENVKVMRRITRDPWFPITKGQQCCALMRSLLLILDYADSGFFRSTRLFFLRFSSNTFLLNFNLFRWTSGFRLRFD